MSVSAGKPSRKFNRVRDGIYITQRDECLGSERIVVFTARYSVEHNGASRPEMADEEFASAGIKSRLRYEVNHEVYQPVVEEIKDIMELVGVPGREDEVVKRLHDMAWDLMRSVDDGGGQTQ